MAIKIRKAEKKQAKLRMAINGPAGSGKTWTALEIASGLGDKILLIDTEGSSSTLYADRFNFDIISMSDFGDNPFNPENFVEAIKAGENGGYDVIIVDSLSHAWAGEGGALDMANKETLRSRSGNTFMAWRNVTPIHNKLINKILQSKSHVIATMRSKEKKVMEQDESGRNKVKTIGMEAVMRDGVNYEFTIVGDLDQEHNMIISKTRCAFLDKAVIPTPSRALGEQLVQWLNSGEAIEQQVEQPAPTIKPAKEVATKITKEEEGSSQEIIDLMDNMVKPWLTKLATEGKEDEAVSRALDVIEGHFDVADILDIPQTKLVDLKSYIKGPLVGQLREEGLLKAK